MGDRLRIVIVGAPGYTGAELAGILCTHPAAEVVGLFGSERRGAAGAEPMSDLFPRLAGAVDLPVRAADAASIVACGPDAVFLATPHEASESLAPALVAAGIAVFDLSAAFRLRDPGLYPRHYGFEHRHPALLADAVYGLPEVAGEPLRSANLVACPGCYPTSVILPVRPLAAAGIIDLSRPVIVDSASGVSGAGRSAAVKSLFCEVSMQAYGVLSHRHQPEMAQETGARILFTPHLMALDRGILSTIHAELAPGATPGSARACLESAYADAPFVRILPPGRWPSVAAVERTNCCDIALGADEAGTHLVISSAIDNLMKGAAGQAVQAFNIRFGLEETAGLGIARRIHAEASR